MHLIASFILSVALLFPCDPEKTAHNGKDKPRTKPTTEIQWQEGRKLTWADFKGKPDPKEDKYALTTSDINVGINCEGNKFNYQVKASFIPSESWTRSLDSDALLAHEQLHFDITELHARKLRLQLSLLPNPCSMDGKEIQKLIDNAYEKWHQMEDEYDRATNHGLNKKAQQEWEKNITLAIKELDRVK